jgi:hypothetical protein
VIAKQLGHSDLKMLHTHHADVDNALIAAAVQKTADHHRPRRRPKKTQSAGKTRSTPKRQPPSKQSAARQPKGGNEATVPAPRGRKRN